MELVEKIMQFQVISNGDNKLFIAKLCKENSWSIAFSKRAFFEYKRFIYLAAVGHHRVVPSKTIDKVWHLHLTFTKSYWIELCDAVLEKKIHHTPSSLSIKSKTRDFEGYNDTITLYKKMFKSEPPTDIWPVKEKSTVNYLFLTFLFSSVALLTACTALPDDETMLYIKWGLGIYAGYRILKWLGLDKSGRCGGGCGSSCSGCGGD
jgi:hypothetical protein